MESFQAKDEGGGEVGFESFETSLHIGLHRLRRQDHLERGSDMDRAAAKLVRVLRPPP